MRPTLSSANVSDLPGANPELFTKCFLGGLGIRPYRENVRLGKDRAPGVGSARVSVALLAHHVGSIVRRGTKEKVVRVYAGPVVAPMANQKTHRYRPIVQFIRDAVGGLAAASIAEMTIAGHVFGGGPIPAFCVRVNRDLFHHTD